MPFQFLTLTFRNLDPAQLDFKKSGSGLPSLGALFEGKAEGALCVLENFDEFEDTVQAPQIQIYGSFHVQDDAAAARLLAAAQALEVPGSRLDSLEMRAHTDQEVRFEELERHLGEEIERRARWAVEAATDTPQP